MEPRVFWIVLFCSIFLVSACTEEWAPESYPVEVVILSEVTTTEREAVTAAVRVWNAALGESVFVLRFAPGEAATCGRINVVFTDRMRASRVGEVQTEGQGQCEATIRIRPGLSKYETAKTAAHELGHVLTGPGHSEDRHSIMHSVVGGDGVQVVNTEDVELARATLEATR